MFRRSKIRLPVAWALLFAVLFNIALPSLATTMRPADAIILGEICSTGGLKTIVASGVDRAPGDHADLLHDGHCQLCSIEPQAFLPPMLERALPGTIRPVPPTELPTFIPARLPRSLPPPSHAPPALS